MCVGGRGVVKGRVKVKSNMSCLGDMEKDWDDKALKESGGGKKQTLAERLSMEEGSIP